VGKVDEGTEEVKTIAEKGDGKLEQESPDKPTDESHTAHCAGDGRLLCDGADLVDLRAS
jgi:hypothetical protein